MKKIKWLLLFLFFSTAIIFAQQKKYVSYIVKKGETIKSIAKTYKMSKRDLLRLNPGVSKKPKPNTVIIVPNKNFGRVIINTNKTNEKLYIVQPKETLFGISRKYGVSIDELKAINPKLKDGLKMGMKLVIPKPSITQAKDSINYVLHTVVIDDTIYNLAKRFEVTEESLFDLNPILEEGLKLGMLLKIKPIEITEDDTTIFKEKIDFTKEIKVVFMLPYQLNKLNDSIRKANFKKSNSLLNYTTDFHLGALMAIDSLRQKGLKINVKYFDTENSDYKIQYIVNQNSFKNADIVIGPLFFDKAQWVSKRTKIPVVSPLFSKKQREFSKNNLVKASPGLEVYENKLLTYLEKAYEGENIIVINDDKPENQSKLWRIVNKLKSFDSIQKIAVLKTKEGFIDSELFKTKLDTLGQNWVLISSDEKVTTSAAINNLKTYAEDVDIQLFALNKGKNFNNISNIFLGKLNFVFPTSEYINIEDNNVKRFYDKYKAENYALPSKYAIRGFDVTYDILVRLASFESLDEGLKAGKSVRISRVFDYKKELFGSFENTGVFLIQYTKDLTPIVIE
ncbi:LysM peptidoglycan-binding domain-containing protein [Lutibacter sp.]|uniref:LysM peptidoglycan-binding domain-containing protein n=1 Tax=Lutibacter sp. TaxID=1925666 RepID=UPI0025B8B1EE|nr:LysM peptidoglycan-binding domain-containing protein [Lutibacter sp.]MCF6167153.1 LysM peptidoglycan-binding domain-containing protein [Lutibacter sp.]